MDLTVGAIIEGKVKSITNFGAFIALPENRTGMVHISEVDALVESDRPIPTSKLVPYTV